MLGVPENSAIYAITAGICAASGSLFGKLSGTSDDRVIQIIFFLFMIVSNAAVWTFFVKALQYSKSSLTATVISAATNYFLSALLGFMLFEEVTSVLWWSGTTLVLAGLVLITRAQENDTKLHQTCSSGEKKQT